MSDTKETNPKDLVGAQKASLSYISGPVTYEVALGMTEGGYKYRRHNYRVYGVRGSVYFDATMRHLWAWWEGQDIDPISQIHHVSKAIASLYVLRDAMIFGNWTDDRPPAVPEHWLDDMNMRHKNMLENLELLLDHKHKPPHTEVEERERKINS